MHISTHFSPLSQEYLQHSTGPIHLTPSLQHPQEDYLLVSKKFSIFVVADGVTLECGEGGVYPHFSGAGEIARIFCQAVIQAAEERYHSFCEQDLKEIFSIGNKAAEAFNISQGRVKGAINYWDIDLFAATTAFALIKENKLYWWTLCDAGITVFDAQKYRIYSSPLAWPRERREKYLLSDVTLKNVAPPERRKMIRRIYRNGINEKGECIGYGVVTGEPAASKYLETGTVLLSPGDTVVAYTDGFEHYLSLPVFVEKFLAWTDGTISNEVESVATQAIKEDPERYGQERSLIAIHI